MELMSEEVLFLLKRGLARVVQYPELDDPPNDSIQQEGECLRQKSFHEQSGLFREERVAHVMKLADKIIEGKKRKHGGSDFDEKEALQKEIDKIPSMSEDIMMVQLFTRNQPIIIKFLLLAIYIYGLLFIYSRAILEDKSSRI